MQTHVKFTRVNDIEVMYERPRVKRESWALFNFYVFAWPFFYSVQYSMERKSTKRRLNPRPYRTQSTDRQTRRLHIFKIFAFIWPLDNTLIILVYSDPNDLWSPNPNKVRLGLLWLDCLWLDYHQATVNMNLEQKNICHITPLPSHDNDHISTTATFFCPHTGCLWVQVQLQGD